ncbi:hypothetical protein BVY04_01575 [bacterium M21]|nr:hypothetical protein BVY04_01575 [bacterium M21]
MFKSFSESLPAKLWLSIATMLVGMIVVVVLTLYQKQETEKLLARMERVNVPSLIYAQRALLAFEMEHRHYRDAVLIGETELLLSAQRRAEEAQDNLLKICKLPGISRKEQLEAEQTITDIARFSVEAEKTYAKLGTAPGDDQLRESVMRLSKESEQLKLRLSTIIDRQRADMSSEMLLIVERGRQQFIIVVGVFVLVAVLATGLALYMINRFVLTPIRKSSEQAKRIAAGNLNERLEFSQNDEIGHLANAMNQMTGQLAQTMQRLEQEVETRRIAENQVREANAVLGERVDERTAELERVHKQMVQVARTAGMAEVATNVLHNIGNVLNSVNVTTSTMRKSVKESHIRNLLKATELLKENEDHLDDFIKNDERGGKIILYLDKLSHTLISDNEKLCDWTAELEGLISHITEIVRVQQEAGKGMTFVERISVAQVLDDAARINETSFKRHNIQVIRQYDPIDEIIADRHLVLQVLTNLLTNAGHAVAANEHGERWIKLRIYREGTTVKISVIDNGIGISPENLSRLFEHGFTTKKDGHGFGLHSAANVATSLKGKLEANSDGIGKGATFELSLPVVNKEDYEQNQECVAVCQ